MGHERRQPTSFVVISWREMDDSHAKKQDTRRVVLLLYCIAAVLQQCTSFYIIPGTKTVSDHSSSSEQSLRQCTKLLRYRNRMYGDHVHEEEKSNGRRSEQPTGWYVRMETCGSGHEFYGEFYVLLAFRGVMMLCSDVTAVI